MTKIDSRSSGNAGSRLQGTERDAGATVSDFVRDHPLLVVAGGIALGAVAAALLPRGTARRIARRAISLAEVAGTAGVLLGTKARETAETTGASLREHGGVVAERLEKLGETTTSRIGKLSSAASARAEKWIDPVEAAASKVAGKVAKKASDLRSRIGH